MLYIYNEIIYYDKGGEIYDGGYFNVEKSTR